MGRTLVGLCVVALVGAVAGVAVLTQEERAPLPSHEELRASGFAVWPEDTLAEGMEACADADPWRLDPKETAFRFVREVFKYPAPTVNAGAIRLDESVEELRYIIGSRQVPGVFLGSVIDVRKYDRCWFVIWVEPREGGASGDVTYTHDASGAQLVVEPGGERTLIGYGTWERAFDGGERRMYDLTGVAPDATGHVLSFHCRKVCDGSGRPLGFVPEPATTDVERITVQEVVDAPRTCRAGHSRSKWRALVKLYAMSVGRSIETDYGKPKVGRFRLTSEEQLIDLGIEPLDGNRWSFTIRNGNVDLVARVVEKAPECWMIVTIEDPKHDPLRSLRVSKDTATFDLEWANATMASFSIGGSSGGDTWYLRRLDAPITVTEVFPPPLQGPFYVSVRLSNKRGLVSEEKVWYRAP